MGQQMSQSLKEKVNHEQIQKEIDEAPVVVYTKSDCGYCKMAKELLDKDRIKYNEHELGKVKVENPNEYQTYVNGLVYITRQTSVPQVFICGKFIGGFTELDQLHKDGQLKDEIRKCSDW